MIPFVLCALIVGLGVAVARWLASIPLLMAITNGIDRWADEVHGEDRPLG